MIKLVLIGVAVLVLVAGAGYYGEVRYEAGQENIRSSWNAEKVSAAEALARETEKVQTLEAKHASLAKEIEDELKPRLEAVTATSSDLARRLRLATSRACSGSTVRLPAPTTTEPLIPSGEPGSGSGLGAPTDAAVEVYMGACARDAERLDLWRQWWSEVQ